MEYIESSSQNTFYPFQNKHQNHQHLQSFRMLCALKKSKHSKSNEMGQANLRPQISTNDVYSIYSISLIEFAQIHLICCLILRRQNVCLLFHIYVFLVGGQDCFGSVMLGVNKNVLYHCCNLSSVKKPIYFFLRIRDGISKSVSSLPGFVQLRFSTHLKVLAFPRIAAVTQKRMPNA